MTNRKAAIARVRICVEGNEDGDHPAPEREDVEALLAAYDELVKLQPSIRSHQTSRCVPTDTP